MDGARIETIMWNDSNMYITQTHISEDWKTCVIESVGYVIEDTKSHVVLAGDCVGDDEVRRVIVIPKENILNRVIWKKGILK